MKRYQLIILATVFLTLSLIIGILVFFLNKEQNPPTKRDLIKYEQNEPLVIEGSYKTRELNTEDPYINFDARYPYFENADLDFNLSIENYLKEQMEGDRLVSKENWKARYENQFPDENIPEVPEPEDRFYFSSDFDVIQSNSSYISFILTYQAYTGGAHGYQIKKSYNYDIKNEKEVSLADVFYNDSDFLNRISKVSRKELMEKYAVINPEEAEGSDPSAIEAYIENMKEFINEGTKPEEKNFQVFTFTPDGIKIYFAQYQVGPYSIGMPEVEIINNKDYNRDY